MDDRDDPRRGLQRGPQGTNRSNTRNYGGGGHDDGDDSSDTDVEGGGMHHEDDYHDDNDGGGSIGRDNDTPRTHTSNKSRHSNSNMKNHASISPQQNGTHRHHESHLHPDDNDQEEENDHGQSSSRRISNGEGDENDEEEEEEEEAEEEEDALVYCRCDTPKALVELLKTFGVAKGSGNGATQQQQQHQNQSQTGKGSRRGGRSSTTTTATATQGTTGGSSSGTMMTQHPMTVFCTKRGLTIHSQSTNAAFQASMELPMALFSEFRLARNSSGNGNGEDEEDNEDNDDEEDINHEFTVHWKTLMECLTVLMTSDSQMSGSGGGSGRSSNNSFLNTSSASASSFFDPSTYRVPQRSLVLSYHTSTELLKIELLSTSSPWDDDGGAAAAGSRGISSTPTNSTGLPLATCALPGLDSTDSLGADGGGDVEDAATAYRSSPIAARCLTKSFNFVPYVHELDLVPGATVVQISFVYQKYTMTKGGEYKPSSIAGQKYIRLKTKGHSSLSVVDIPGPVEIEDTSTTDNNNSNKNIHRVTHSYSLASWRQALQPLDLARETCISVNREGILAIQHQLVLKDVVNGEKNSTSATNGNKRRRSSGSNSNNPHGGGIGNPGLDDDTAAFCDFLVLPLADLDDGDNLDSDSEAGDNEDEDYDDVNHLNDTQSEATTTVQNTQPTRRDAYRTTGPEHNRAPRQRVAAAASTTSPAVAAPTATATALSSRSMGSQSHQSQSDDGDRIDSQDTRPSQASTTPSKSPLQNSRTSRDGINSPLTFKRDNSDRDDNESDTDAEADGDRPLPSSHRRPLLFGRPGSSGGGNRNSNGGSTLDDSRTADSTTSASQMTEESSSVIHQNHSSRAASSSRAMDRDRRKRQRLRQQQRPHRRTSHDGSNSTDHDQDNNRDTSGISWRDVDAGNSSTASDHGDRRRNNDNSWRPNRGYGEPASDDEEDRYCSSPELVYGDEE